MLSKQDTFQQATLSLKEKTNPAPSHCVYLTRSLQCLCVSSFQGLRFKNKIELACKCSCPFKDRTVTQTSIREVSRAHEGPFSSLWEHGPKPPAYLLLITQALWAHGLKCPVDLPLIMQARWAISLMSNLSEKISPSGERRSIAVFTHCN